MSNHKTLTLPKSRIASIDVCKIGKKKHHIAAFIEVDVTTARRKNKCLPQAERECLFQCVVVAGYW